MKYENIYKFKSFLCGGSDERHANELVQNGWHLLDIVPFKDPNNCSGKYIVGATKEVYETFNYEMIKERERKKRLNNRS